MSRLAPGGVSHIIDAHRFLTVFDDFAPEPPLREYPVVAWKALEFTVRDDDGLRRLPPEAGDIPLMFGLSVRKPA